MAGPKKKAARAVRRHLNFAWIEIEETQDGCAFHSSFSSSALGWRNLMLQLPRGKGRKRGRRIDNAHPELEIKWHRYGRARGLLIRPKNKSEADFLSEWTFNPGIKKISKHKVALTSAMDFTDQADMMIVSGHGSSGDVWGNWNGKLPRRVTMFLKNWIGINSSRAGSSGRVKYLLIPACYCAPTTAKSIWLPAFEKSTPLHGILGFNNMYKGGAPGARLMRKFAKECKRKPAIPIVEAWRNANKAMGANISWNWGAILLEPAKKDTMKKWVSTGLSVKAQKHKIYYINESNWNAGGVEVQRRKSDIDAFFYMADGTKIDQYTISSNPKAGLIMGQKGKLVITNNRHAFSSWMKGNSILVTFYLFRPRHPDMKLDKLLKFDSSRVKLRVDTNKADGKWNKYIDGFEYEFNDKERKSGVAEIHYTVLPDAYKTFKVDVNMPKNVNKSDPTYHGKIWIRITRLFILPSYPAKRNLNFLNVKAELIKLGAP